VTYIIEYRSRDSSFYQVETNERGQVVAEGRLETLDALKGIIADYLRQQPLYDVNRSGRYELAGPIPEDAAVEEARLAIRVARSEHTNRDQFANLLGGTIRDGDMIDFLLRHDLVDRETANRAWPALAFLQNFSPASEPVLLPANRIDNSQSQGVTGTLPAAQSTGAAPPQNTTVGGGRSDSGGQGTATANASDARTGGDPVILFSGQLYYQAVDLELKGRGLHFVWTRTYLNQTYYKGPLGYSWDHSYNLWLREDRELQADGGYRNVVHRSTGELREDKYVQITETDSGDTPPLDEFRDAAFRAPAGFFDRLEKNGGRYTLETTGGIRYVYNEDLQIERIVDPNGNQFSFFYDALRLVRIVDPVGKEILIAHDSMNRIVELEDRTGGRRVRYTYTDNGDLEEVDLLFEPDLAAGTDYRYSGPDRPYELQHNLVAIIAADGETVLECDYGEEPGTGSWNRVVRQRAQDGEYRYEYDWIGEPVEDEPEPDPLNQPRFSTLVMHPNGHVIEHGFNQHGNVVFRREQVLDRSGTWTQLTAAFRYDEEGLVILERDPLGGGTAYEYERTRFAELRGDVLGATPAERLSFGNLLRRIELPRAGSGDERRIVTEYEYEQNRVSRQRGPYYANVRLEELPGQEVGDVRYRYDRRGNLIEIVYPELLDADGGHTRPASNQFRYDEHGSLIEMQTGAIRTTYEYFDDTPRSGFLRRMVRDADGTRQIATYDADPLGRATKIVDALGAETRFEWTTFDAPKSVRASALVTYSYDRCRRLLQVIEQIESSGGTPHPDGALVTTQRYDAYGRVVERTLGTLASPRMRSHRTVFHPSGSIAREEHANGLVTAYEYDERMLLRRVTRGWGTDAASARRVAYSHAAQVVELTDATGSVTHIAYDAFGRVARVVYPDGTETHLAHDASDRIVRTEVWGRHPEGGEWVLWSRDEWRHDAAGHVIEQISHAFVPGEGAPVAQSTKSFIDEFGRVIRTVDGEGFAWTTRYDGSGRVVERVDPDGCRETFEYRDDGRTTLHTREDVDASTSTRFAFTGRERRTVRGMLEEREDELGNVTRFGYDSRRLREWTESPGGERTTTDYDVFGQTTATRRRLGDRELITRVEYTSGGDLLAITAPTGARFGYEHDALGRSATETHEGSAIRMRYDDENRPLHKILQSGLQWNFRYSQSGLLEQRSAGLASFTPPVESPGYRPADGDPQSFRHSPLGMLWEARAGSRGVRQIYDSLRRLVTEESDGRRTTFEYDRRNLLTRLRNADGRQVRYDYSPAGRLLAIVQEHAGTEYPGDATLPVSRMLARVERAGDRLLRLDHGDVRALRQCDRTGMPVGIDWLSATHGPLLAIRLLFNASGQPMLAHVGGRLSLLDHDSMGRLIRERRWSAQPPLDVSPLLPFPGSTARQETVAGLLDRARPASPAASDMRWELDDNGNRLAVHGAGAPVTCVPRLDDRYESVGGLGHVYDRDGNLLADGVRHYRYDAFGRLVEIASAGGSWRRSYDALGRVYEFARPEGVRRYEHAGGRLIGWQDDDGTRGQLVPWEEPHRIAHLAFGGSDYVPLVDPAGTIFGWADAAGRVAALRDYDAFGVPEPSGAWPAPFGFSGLEYDAGSGLYFTHARPYDPRLGRFLSPDPAGLVDGTNLYAYALNAPDSFSDHWGFAATDSHIDVHTAIRAAAQTAVTAAAFTAVGLMAVALFPVAAPLVLLAGGVMALTIGFGVAYESRHDEAIRVGRGDNARVALAALEDAFGVTGIHEGLTGRTIIGDQRMSTRARSEELGTDLFNAATTILPAAGPAVRGVRRIAGRGNALLRTIRLEHHPSVPAGIPPLRLGGAATESGIGVLSVSDYYGLQPHEQRQVMEAIAAMDARTRAAAARGTPHRVRNLTAADRKQASSAAREARRAQGYPDGVMAHLPDAVAGGDLTGPFLPVPHSVNSGWGPVVKQAFDVNFTFEGWALVDRRSGRWLYMSELVPGQAVPEAPVTGVWRIPPAWR